EPAGERATFFWISVFYAPLVVGASLWCVIRIKERYFEPTFGGFFSGFKDVWQNRPFVILLVAYTIAAVGSNLPATLILYYVQYVLQSDAADFFLLLYFVTGIVFLPGWVRLSYRIGKKAAWIASMALNTGAFAGVFFLGPGDAVLYGVLVFFSGIGFGATLAIPSAIQADVIDYDELRTGTRQEGRYIGLWSIAKKFAAAVGVGVGLFFLGAAGYVPNAEQNDTVVFTLRVLYALVPSVCNIIGLLVALAYPITADTYREIRSAIENRKAGQKACDPLRPAQCYVGPASV
ncbi:MAG: MFS transporter, partial [Desulfobacterales bacterium]